MGASQLLVSSYALLLSPVSHGGNGSVREGLLCPNKDMKANSALKILNLFKMASCRRRETGYRFSVWSGGWSEYQFLEASGKERQPSVLLPRQSDDKTLMRHVGSSFKRGHG